MMKTASFNTFSSTLLPVHFKKIMCLNKIHFSFYGISLRFSLHEATCKSDLLFSQAKKQ